jgi:hypothetical protein
MQQLPYRGTAWAHVGGRAHCSGRVSSGHVLAARLLGLQSPGTTAVPPCHSARVPHAMGPGPRWCTAEERGHRRRAVLHTGCRVVGCGAYNASLWAPTCYTSTAGGRKAVA